MALLMRRLGRLVSRFQRDRRGNFVIMAGFSLPMLVLAAGYGVNIGQITLTKTNLLQALDAAVTSTARDLTTGAITDKEAPKVFEALLSANGLRAYAEEGKLKLDSLVIDKKEKTVKAQASVILDVAFPLFGIDNRQIISAGSAALYSDKKIEVAMMLDVTGSMQAAWPDDKMGDLKKAAKNAVTTLLASNKPTNPRIRIALVPYANSVNVGKAIADVAVFAERNALERIQAPGNTAWGALNTAKTRKDNCATERKGLYALTDDGPERSMVNRDFLLDSFAAGYYDPIAWVTYAPSATCPNAEILPLTSDAKRLTDRIDSFVAAGGTGGHIGVQWAWYMLSEKWKNVVGVSAAAAKTDPNAVAKYAILMTDGEFNLGFDGALLVHEVYGSVAALRSVPRAKLLCAEMRKAGIEIFTIGFKLQPQHRDVMRSCATPDTGGSKHFYDTANGEELNAAFNEIARNIERLALTN